jgi:glutamate-1-semialdehyde 2,1-aminomutase
MRDRYETSRRMLEHARASLTGGVSSPFRGRVPVPLFFADGCGPRLTDVDGNQYIDYALAWGPLILGHRHPALVEALTSAAARPHQYGAQHALEAEVAQKVQAAVPCAKRVAFTSSGSEAVQLMLRLARAATGREKILRFEGHYHGWMDSVLISYRGAAEQLGPADHPVPLCNSRGQVANAVDNLCVAEWNRLEAIEALLEAQGEQIAAVITEPILCNSGCLMPREGFLAALRELTRRHGILLLFDEIITGFRTHLGGAQALFNVTPDMATFGKAVGGGATLSLVGGRREIMELMVDGNVAFGGTFNGNPLSMAAANATLTELATDDAAALRNANAIGAALQQGIREAALKAGIPVHVAGPGAAFSIHFTERDTLETYRHTLDDDKARLERFIRLSLDYGLYLLPDGRFYVSAVHGEAELDQTLAIVSRVFDQLA